MGRNQSGETAVNAMCDAETLSTSATARLSSIRPSPLYLLRNGDGKPHEGIPATACAMNAPGNGCREQINIDAPLIARTLGVNRAASVSTSERRRSVT